MSDDIEEPGLDVRPVLPGYEYILKHGDGTATKGWAPTRQRALELGQEAGE